jgi:hypothetical protein
MSKNFKYFTEDFERIFGLNYLTETHSLGFGDWLRKTFCSEIVKVGVRHEGMTGSGLQSRCHDNVDALVNIYGGSRVGGFLIDDDNEIRSERLLRLVYHSVWLTPENRLVDVTANNFTDESHVIFLPVVIDKLTSVQFDDMYLERRGVMASIERDPKQTSDFAKAQNYKTIGFHDPRHPEEILEVLALIPFSEFRLDMVSYDLMPIEGEEEMKKHVFDYAGFRNPSSATGRHFDEIVSLRTRSRLPKSDK